MSRLKRRDTSPEVRVRSELHRNGLRFRVVYPVPGFPRRSIDVAFPRARVAVFIDGCFWHRCAAHGTTPTNNAAWWQTKLSRTVDRDRETDAALVAAGWTVLRFWEHESPDHVAEAVARTVRGRLPAVGS